jgi:hypothetical protein
VIEVVGLLALAAGDRRTAVDRLGQCLTWAESHVTDERTAAFWREAADRARDLPSEGCG